MQGNIKQLLLPSLRYHLPHYGAVRRNEGLSSSSRFYGSFMTTLLLLLLLGLPPPLDEVLEWKIGQGHAGRGTARLQDPTCRDNQNGNLILKMGH